MSHDVMSRRDPQRPVFMFPCGGRGFLALENAVFIGGPIALVSAIWLSWKHRTLLCLVGGILGYLCSGLIMGLVDCLANMGSLIPVWSEDKMMAITILLLLVPCLLSTLYFLGKIRSVQATEK